MYLYRSIEKSVSLAAEIFPIVLVTGARQVGKTTLLRRMMERAGVRHHVSLGDPLRRELAVSDPGLFMQGLKPPVFIDEIQYAPQLLPYLKMHVDASGEPGQIWLAGTRHFHHLMRDAAVSLAGRVGILRLSGLSNAEMPGGGNCAPFMPASRHGASRRVMSMSEMYRHIWSGSCPRLLGLLWRRDAAGEPVFQEERAEEVHHAFYGEYVEAFLRRDVRDLARTGDTCRFLRFMRACAARTGQPLNFAALARDAGVSASTAGSWLEVLEATDVVHLLRPWVGGRTKRLARTPRLHFLDTGLVSYLTGWTSPKTLERGAMSRAMFATWAVAEMLRSWWHCGRQAPMYFYRDRDGREIDVLIERDGKVHPIAIRNTASPRRDDVRHFSALERLGCPMGGGALVCMHPGELPLTETCSAIPAWWI